jgi:hypothetical protein
MRAFQKSLKAGQEKMSAAVSAAVTAVSTGADSLNNQLPQRYKIPGSAAATAGSFLGADGSGSGANIGGSNASNHNSRGGDGAAEPGAHLLIRVECAEGLDHHATFVVGAVQLLNAAAP